MRDIMEFVKRDRSAGGSEHKTHVSYIIWSDKGNLFSAVAQGDWESPIIPRCGENIRVFFNNPEFNDTGEEAIAKRWYHGVVDEILYEVVDNATYITIIAVQPF